MHYFNDFKGFADAKLNLFEPLTVVIGPNGSGKTNLIEGIELLSFLAHGRPLHEVVDVGRGAPGALEIRGGLQSCSRHGTNSFALGFSARVPFEGRKAVLNYRIEIQSVPEPRIVTEHLILDHDQMVFETTEAGDSMVSGDVRVRYNNFARGGKKPIASVVASRSVLFQYSGFAEKNKKKNACVRLVGKVMDYLRASFVFDPQPATMRSYERLGSPILTRNGANLSAVLHALRHGRKEDKEKLDRILKRIRQVPEEPFDDFDFHRTPTYEVIFGLKQGGNGALIDARVLSDGTLRCLAVLTALETVEEGSRVVIEEFDNGLHPSRLRILTDALASCCERRRLNVLVTTHNPGTLDALQPEQLESVVMCVWDQERRAFTLVRLSDLPQYPEILEKGRLGDLVTRQIIEKYLAPGFEEERTQEALRWLKSLG